MYDPLISFHSAFIIKAQIQIFICYDALNIITFTLISYPTHKLTVEMRPRPCASKKINFREEWTFPDRACLVYAADNFLKVMTRFRKIHTNRGYRLQEVMFKHKHPVISRWLVYVRKMYMWKMLPIWYRPASDDADPGGPLFQIVRDSILQYEQYTRELREFL